MNNYNQEEYIKKMSFTKIRWSTFVALIILLGIFVYFYNNSFFKKYRSDSGSSYQAVFLSNGQVYFGSIHKMDDDYLVLKNIYYLQANNNVQGSNDSQPFSLVKLGKELHGPTDTMYINRSQILFYEDLRSDSNVVKVIESYKTE